MRRGKDGKYHKNGFFRAYYANGRLEREGHYVDDKRVGVWTMYNQDGTVQQTSNFGDGWRRPIQKRTESGGDGASGSESGGTDGDRGPASGDGPKAPPPAPPKDR